MRAGTLMLAAFAAGFLGVVLATAESPEGICRRMGITVPPMPWSAR